MQELKQTEEVKKILEKTASFMTEKGMTEEGMTVAIAFSGGNDSLAMTLLLKELSGRMGFSLLLFHVNHHIRGEAADADAAFARDFAEKEGLPAQVFDVDPVSYAAGHAGVSVEEAARVLRYRAMAEALQSLPGEKKVLAVAHHMEDAAETILFRLARGTGPAGMGALKPVAVLSSFSEVTLIRPVLHLTREELEEVVAASPYTAREDATNEDDDIARNRIRHVVLPALSEINSGAVSHIVSFAEKTAAEHDLIEYEAVWNSSLFKDPGLPVAYDVRPDIPERKPGMKGIFDPADEAARLNSLRGKDISRISLSQLSEIRAQIAVRLWLRANIPSMRDVGEAHIAAIIESAAAGKAPGLRTDLPGGISTVTTYETITLVRTEAYLKQFTAGNTETVQISLGELERKGSLTVSCMGTNITFDLLTGEAAERIVSKEIPPKTYTKYLDYGTIQSDFLCLRTRREGDAISFAPGKTKNLRRYFIDEKIPEEERGRCLLLADGSRIVWAIGHRIGADYRVGAETEDVLRVTRI